MWPRPQTMAVALAALFILAALPHTVSAARCGLLEGDIQYFANVTNAADRQQLVEVLHGGGGGDLQVCRQ